MCSDSPHTQTYIPVLGVVYEEQKWTPAALRGLGWTLQTQLFIAGASGCRTAPSWAVGDQPGSGAGCSWAPGGSAASLVRSCLTLASFLPLVCPPAYRLHFCLLSLAQQGDPCLPLM